MVRKERECSLLAWKSDPEKEWEKVDRVEREEDELNISVPRKGLKTVQKEGYRGTRSCCGYRYTNVRNPCAPK